jgi:hypothetical protein
MICSTASTSIRRRAEFCHDEDRLYNEGARCAQICAEDDRHTRLKSLQSSWSAQMHDTERTLPTTDALIARIAELEMALATERAAHAFPHALYLGLLGISDGRPTAHYDEVKGTKLL